MSSVSGPNPALDWITRDAPGPVKEPKYHTTQGHYQDIYIKKRKSCLWFPPANLPSNLRGSLPLILPDCFNLSPCLLGDVISSTLTGLRGSASGSSLSSLRCGPIIRVYGSSFIYLFSCSFRLFDNCVCDNFFCVLFFPSS